MEIPLVDFSGYDESRDETLALLGAEVERALSSSGFMTVKNMGISSDQLRSVFAASRSFFESEHEQKMQLSYASADDNFGYQSLGMERLDTNKPVDLKETLTMRAPEKHMDAAWPNDEFRDLMIDFYHAAFQSAYRIQRVIAQILHLPRDFFVSRHSGENVTLRLLHYPPVNSADQGQLGAGAHTDYGMLTLLFQDMAGGLEVFDRANKRWIEVEPVENAVVINTGDLMERWSNRRFKSTPHRVRPRLGQSARYSIAMFFDPDADVLIECIDSCLDQSGIAQFKPISAGDYIRSRIARSHS